MSISRSSHLRAVSTGSTPGFSAAILWASVSATAMSGSSEVMNSALSRRSDAENAGVALPDGTALLFHGRGIILQGLDVLERGPSRLLFGLRMQRAQSADVDNELLGFAAETERLEKFRRVGVRRTFENAVGADDHRRSLRGINRRHGTPALSQLQDVVLVAVGHDGAFAKLKLLRRIGRGLHLHDIL